MCIVFLMIFLVFQIIIILQRMLFTTSHFFLMFEYFFLINYYSKCLVTFADNFHFVPYLDGFYAAYLGCIVWGAY